MKVFYRISDAGYKKIKHPLINNKNCLENFINNFLNKRDLHNFIILADNISNDTFDMIKNFVPEKFIIHCKLGSSAQTFNKVLSLALEQKDDNEIIYFVENDYIHRKNSKAIMEEGLELGADFVCLYDHPDKYIDADKGGNPQIQGGGETTKVLLSKSTHWKLCNSTTMTFAAKVGTLKETEPIIRKWTTGTYPEDYRMFVELGEKGYSLISPIPSYSTHGELPWLAPLIDWEREIV